MQYTEAKLFVADWGTSNLRLWALDSENNIIEKAQSASGMAKLSSAEFEPVLEEFLSDFGVKTNAPVLICGMAGAAQGWCDAGYMSLAEGVEAIAAHAKIVETKSGRDVRILPGLAQFDEDDPDVMRGEETLLLGAHITGLNYKTYCFPGTHSKWVFMKDNNVSSFNTIMTGELFSLFSEQSILFHFLKNAEEGGYECDVFKEAVMQMINHPEAFTKYLFKLRAEPLLNGDVSMGSLRAKLSGWLIGLEIVSVREKVSDKVALVTNGVLEESYRSAFEAAGINYDVIDSEALVVAGLKSAAQKIWGEHAGA